MDLSKLSMEDLQALREKRIDKLSDEGLRHLRGTQESFLDKAKNIGLKTADYGLRGLDYLGGLARGTAGEIAGAVTGDDLVDWEQVLKGKAPTVSAMMEKSGVPEGASLSDYIDYGKPNSEWYVPEKGGMLDPSIRGTAGFMGDVVLDPLTYLTGGASALGKEGAQKALLRPTAGLVEKAGEKLYKSGLKNIDTRIAEKGGEAVSPYALKQGMWGGPKSMGEQMDARLSELGKQRGEIYKTMEDVAGSTVNPTAASQPAIKYLDGLKENPYMAPKVQEYMDYLALAKDPMSVSQASKVKTQLYDSLPSGAFDELGRLTNTGKEVNKQLGLGYKTQIEKAGDAFQPGVGKQIADLNQEMGAYISAQKPARTELNKEARKNLQTQIDFMTMLKPVLWGAKQAGKVYNAPAMRTGAGLLMNRAGEKVPESVWRNILLNPLRDEGQ